MDASTLDEFQLSSKTAGHPGGGTVSATALTAVTAPGASAVVANPWGVLESVLWMGSLCLPTFRTTSPIGD